jgi:hypothetical protein
MLRRPKYFGIDVYGPPEGVTVASGGGSQSILNTMDSVARAAPSYATNSIKDLAKYFDGHGKNQIEKARLIFVWIANNVSYDWKTYQKNGGSTAGNGASLFPHMLYPPELSINYGFNNYQRTLFVNSLRSQFFDTKLVFAQATLIYSKVFVKKLALNVLLSLVSARVVPVYVVPMPGTRPFWPENWYDTSPSPKRPLHPSYKKSL